LFTEVTPIGDSPVSIPGVGYDLIEATSPDPGQIISLSGSIGADLLEPSIDAEAKIGDLVELVAGPIVDTNGNIVPDKTPVDFILNYQGETSAQVQLSATTNGGISQTSTTIDRGSVLNIRVESSGALVSETITLNIPIPESAADITEIPELTITPDVEPTASEDVMEVTLPTEENGNDQGNNSPAKGISEFLLAFAGLVIGSVLVFTTAKAVALEKITIVRYILVAICSGMVFYNYLAWGLPGSAIITESLGAGGELLWSAAGSVLIAPVLLYRERPGASEKRSNKTDKQEGTG